jgi:hypothetical protein
MQDLRRDLDLGAWKLIWGFASTFLQEERVGGDFFRSASEMDGGKDDEYFIALVSPMYEVAPVSSILHTVMLGLLYLDPHIF